MTTQLRFAVLPAALLALTSLASPAPAHSAEYAIDKDHTNVGFTIRHLFSKVDGRFKDFEGAFSYDPKKPEASTVTFKAKSTSIDTGNEKRDGHLRSGDFLDVEKYPELAFAGKSVKAKGKNRLSVSGDLTIHGVTKPVVLDVEYLGSDKDPWGGTRAGFTATTRLKRKDFGIVWNKTLESGNLMLGEDVDVKLNVEGLEKK